MIQNSSAYVFDEENGIWLRPDAGEFSYSDGEKSENDLLAIMKSTNNKSVFSGELLKHMTSWMTTYYLSPRRSNLLRLFSDYFSGKKVLELGCGCGAITRFLAECGAEVSAVEGSPRRAAIARSRCEGMNNVTIYCDRILDISFEPGSFDCVTLIGVLEYARRFGKGADPVQDTLVKARSMLRKGGILFLAIENQVGLKYLSGVIEDHVGQPFWGVNDCYRPGEVVTFPRAELDARLARAGYGGRKLFIPLPDYKIVGAMLCPSSLAAPAEEFDPTLLILKNLPPDMARAGLPVFSLEQASRVMVRGGLTADLANSFLFVASAEEQGVDIVDDAVLAVHYGSFCSAEYAKEVVFRRGDEGIVVQRRNLVSGANPSGPFVQHLLDEPYVNCSESMQDALLRAVNRPGWDGKSVAVALRPWVAWLRAHSRADDSGRRMLPAEFFDAAPHNILLSADGPVFIDKEWDNGKELELDFVVFRNIFIALSSITSTAVPAKGTSLQVAVLTLQAMALNGVTLASSRLDEYYSRIQELNRQVFGSSVTREWLESFSLLGRLI